MAEEDFQKERRDWWKEVYVASCVKTNNPQLSAEEALKQFDDQFKEEGSAYRNLKSPKDQEQGGVSLTTKRRDFKALQEFLKIWRKWPSKS